MINEFISAALFGKQQSHINALVMVMNFYNNNSCGGKLMMRCVKVKRSYRSASKDGATQF